MIDRLLSKIEGPSSPSTTLRHTVWCLFPQLHIGRLMNSVALPRANISLPLLGRSLAYEAATNAWPLHITLIWYHARHVIRLNAGAVAMIGAADLHLVPGPSGSST